MSYKDKEKRNEHQRYYAKTHRAAMRRYAKKYDEKMHHFISIIKQNIGCRECGENNPICLVFHHVNPEEKSFALGTAWQIYGKDKILEEMNKCIVLCRNCHAKLHARGNNGRIV